MRPPRCLRAASARTPSSQGVSWLYLFSDLVFYRVFLRFGLHFGSQNRPEIEKKNGKNESSNMSPVLLEFFCRFSLKFCPSAKGRTFDFARPYGTLATFWYFCISAVGSFLGSVLDSKTLPKTPPKSIPSVKKRLRKRTSKMTLNFDGIFLHLGSVLPPQMEAKN